LHRQQEDPAFGPVTTTRRLRVVDAAEAPVNFNGLHGQIDLSGIRNASARDSLAGLIEEKCNLGCWHITERFPLPVWANP
jgi:hypothetical protein